VRGIDLKIDDIWGLDLFMTGRDGKPKLKRDVTGVMFVLKRGETGVFCLVINEGGQIAQS
jgi:hypothetical protein